MAGLHASASTSALHASRSTRSTDTPPLPPIRHSISQQTLRHAASPLDPPSTPPNRHSRPVGYAKGKEPAGSRQANHARKEERHRQATAAGATTPRQAAPRHSHGLSWSSTTRDSLVDNLLTSLDGLSQLANRNYDDGHDIEPDWSRFDALNASFTTMPRPRGHTYSSSVSSDHPIPESPSSVVSSPAHKSRRSASSSNFGVHHTLSSRVRSRFANEKFLASDTEKFSKSQTNINGESNHARGWSDASSMDNFHEALEAPPRIGLGGPRSISVDQIRPLSTGQDSMLNRGRPVPSVYSRYETPFDAAPEPMVPAGPRKMQNPNATGPVYVNAAPKQSALRKITTQSDLRAVSSPTVPPEIRERASDFVRGNSMLDNTAERQGHVTQSARREAHSPPREKPGFFKRVFGGGGKSANERVEASHNAVEHKPVSPAPPMKQESRQVSADHSVSSSQQPALNKKPSSFFRRRKKSTSDADKPPPPPLSLADRMQAQETSRASVSSLRKVMDPFLADDPMKSNLKPTDSRPVTRASVLSDDIDIFHSGYTPPVVDVARTKSAKSTVGARSINAAQENESPRMKLKVRKRNIDPPATATSQSSFGSAGVDAALLTQSALTFIKTNGDTSHIEPPKVSPMSELTPSINDDRRVSALGPHELPTPPETTQEMRDFAAGNNVDLSMDGDSWIVAREQAAAFPPSNVGATARLVLQPSEEGLVPLDQTLSVPQSEYSTSRKESTTQSIPQPEQPAETTTDSQLSAAYIDATAEYKQRARRIFDGNESDVSKMDAASWLGESKTLNTRTLHEYMALYDFAQMNILTALRTLCSKLVLRGETQQFDRIITALSSRWCECNPNHGFKAQDVVHTICYSLILLNTDLHLADIGEKMSKGAYVKNTLPTVKRVVADAAPNAFEAQPRPWVDSSAPTSPSLPPDTPQDRTSFDSARPNGLSKRNSIRPGALRNDSDAFVDTTSSNMLVTAPWTGPARGWENEVEVILKSFFTSIRNEPLPLLSLQLADQSASNANLSVNNLGLKRTGSVVSKAPSDALSSRSRGTGLRNLTLGWQGRNNRSRQKIFSTYTMSSSRTSFDDNNSIWSPAQSSTWSKNSAGRTLTSTSMNSLAASYMGGDRDFKHSIGFANALSHAIIREEGGGIVGADSESLVLKGDLLEDESLMLEGAPWAKEGMVKHKHHLEGPDRKAKERSWNECFAVISRGKLTLFNFNTEVKTRSLGRPRTKQGSQAPSLAGTRVGGGDWMENAEQLGVFVLRHTISSTLPPPGYSKARPFVWALSLPSGAVHLFQVGTPEIAQEWMTTANYWSARLSKEPLSGGVSNIEYGWSDAVINSALLEKSSSFNSPPPSIATRPQTHGRNSSTGTGTRQSVQSSMRSSFDVGGGSRQRLPGDKVQITEWAPPSQSIMASQLPEAEQLRALTNYVSNVEAELEKHHELKHAIELAYSPRHSNYNKAMNNWQRKSEYLLREVVKFRTYIDSLVASQKSKEEVYTRRAERGTGRGLSTSSGNAVDGLAPSVNGQSLSRMSSNVSASTVSLHAGRV